MVLCISPWCSPGPAGIPLSGQLQSLAYIFDTKDQKNRQGDREALIGDH